MWFSSLGLVLLLQSVIFANAAFERCNTNYYIDASRSVVVNSPNYPNKYDSGSSCQYTFTAPDDYEIYIECNMNLDKGSTCTTEYFFVSQDADPSLRGASQFCGSGSVARVSEYNKISFAYTSTSRANSNTGGTFSCRVTARAQACDCGWSLRGRIVGGSDTRPTEFPSMVGIVVEGNVVCGGSIINHRTIVTANHCIRLYPDKNKMQIVVGDYDIASQGESRYERAYGVYNLIEHPSYNPNGEFNDIGLIITISSIEYSRGVGPICLPLDTTSTFDYYDVALTGWGTTSLGGPRPSIMRKTTVGIIANSECQKQYPSLQSSQMCTFRRDKDSCQFDSGGPVTYFGYIRQYLLGLISYGRNCGGIYAGVNVRITSYIDWIRAKAVGPICFKPFQ